MTATMTKLSDADPYEWPNALENAFGHWEDLLSDPDELEARAADLRTGNEIDERDTALEDLIGRLDELLSDPERLEARAAAMRAAGAATEAAEAQWGIDGAAFMAGDAAALAPCDESIYKVSYVTGLQRELDQLTELVKGLGDFRRNPDNLCDDCDARLYSHLQAAFAGMRAQLA